ncbi:zinc-binding dehydrogenase [Oerskovia sp. M15]
MSGNGSPPTGARAVGAADAPPGAIGSLTAAVTRGDIRIPIDESFAIDRIDEALALKADQHVHGKIVVRF